MNLTAYDGLQREKATYFLGSENGTKQILTKTSYEFAGYNFDIYSALDASASHSCKGLKTTKTTYITENKQVISEMLTDIKEHTIYEKTNGETKRTSAYYANGQLARQTDALGNITKYEYGYLNKVTKTYTPFNTKSDGSVNYSVTENQYDKNGNVTLAKQTVQKQDSDTIKYSVTENQYNAQGLLTQVTLSDGTSNGEKNITKYFYNNAGIQTKMYTGLNSTNDSDYMTTNYEYDAWGHLVRTTDSTGYNSGATTYDLNGNALTVTDANGNVTTNTYDALNRVLTANTICSDTSKNVSKSYVYDNMGRVRSKTANGVQTSYQNSACIPGKPLSGGQQGGIPMEEMDAYVQDILDLIEYANGDPKKNKWAKMRAEAGHPKPFNLKYIGIGNEDLITPIFEERFEMIFKAVKEKYPEITVIGTVGPFYEGTDYEAGWKFATRLNVPMVDEHYYNTPGWFINNQDYYDRYDRTKPKVYLGEYAAHLPGRPNNIETALAEALYLTSVERNGDIVSMTSYAPLLAKEGHTQWNPDLIYFNNREVKPTVGYYTQQLYGQNSGDTYLPADRKIDNPRQDVQKRIGTSVVRDSKTGDWIVKLVNLLPVPVKTKVEGLTQTENGKAVLQVLSGKPTDKNARPVKKDVSVTELSQYEMPAYSLSVIRIKSDEMTK